VNWSEEKTHGAGERLDPSPLVVLSENLKSSHGLSEEKSDDSEISMAS